MKRPGCAPAAAPGPAGRDTRTMKIQIVAALSAALILSGCLDQGKKKFVAQCNAKGLPGETCGCYFDVASDALNSKQMDMFQAMILGDDREMARISASLGLVDGATMATKMTWVGANAEQACGSL